MSNLEQLARAAGKHVANGMRVLRDPTAPITRSDFLDAATVFGGGVAGAGILLGTVSGCDVGGNTAPGVSNNNVNEGVPAAQWIRGIEAVEMPVYRSAVVIEGLDKHNKPQTIGHGVISYNPRFPNDPNHLVFLTAFHVVDLSKQDPYYVVNWRIDDATLGKIDLIDPQFTLLSNTHTPDYHDPSDESVIVNEYDGIYMCQLDASAQQLISEAVAKGDIIPAQIVSRPRDAIDRKGQVVGFVMTDSAQNEGKVAMLIDPGYDTNSPDHNYSWSIRAGDFCEGESGMPLFLVDQQGHLTNQLVAIAVGFFPTEDVNTDPEISSSQQCTNSNVIGTVFSNQ